MNNITTRSSDTYAYGVGLISVLAIDFGVFSAYKYHQEWNRERAKEQRQPIIPPK